MVNEESLSLRRRMYERNVWVHYVSVLAVIIVLGNLIVASTSDIVVAAEKDGSELEDFVMGQVTDKRENLIRIDSKEYPFFADVIVKDQNLSPRVLKDVVPGTQVMFHLKQGRIDQIIILFPS
jgi:hypothetical protein